VVVPRRLRADWRREWEAELRYREELLLEWDNLNWRGKLALLWHSVGALADALWLQPRRLEEEMFQDLRYGVRMLLKGKMFTAIALLSLATGIGANTAIFSLINALMLRTLPVRAPQELALFSILETHGTSYTFNYPLYEMIRDHNQSFTGVIAESGVGPGRLVVKESGAGGVVETAQHQRVSGNFFSVLGTNVIAGRALTEEDDAPGNSAAVISYDFWRRRFNLDPGVIGRQIDLNDVALTIVGVAPPGFFGFQVGSRPELWWPIKAQNDSALKKNRTWWLQVAGRLRTGASPAQAQAEAEQLFQQQVNEIAGPDASGWTPTERRDHFERHIALESGSAGHTWLRQKFRRPLQILMATVALVLLIACVNVANLLLARAAARRKEVAVRLAVGAGRFRLIRQLLTESLLLATIGGAGGLFIAYACSQALLNYLPQETRNALDVPLDARVLGFTLAVSVLTGLLFGLAPAWQATRINLTTSLKAQSGAGAGHSRLRLNKLLVVTQVALSFFLLIGAGLFARSLRNLQTLDAGINYENVVGFYVDSGKAYNLAQRVEMHRRAMARLEALPGARSATVSNVSLLAGWTITDSVKIPGYTPGPDENMDCHSVRVGPRFFETMGMPLLAGRDFGTQDERPAQPAQDASNAAQGASPKPVSAIINQSMARYFFGNENPIGKRFDAGRDAAEIIGVVKDAKYTNLREQPPRTFYLYYLQDPPPSDMVFYLRAEGDAAGYAAPIRRLMREIDPQLQINGIRTMAETVNESLMQERFIAQVAGAFSLFALLLACVGLYGVMSYGVNRRTSEIGIRMALGAQTKSVVWLVMREVSLLLAVGIFIGLGAALATTRLAESMLFGLAPNDPTTIAAASMLMAGVAALAGYIPARRASRIDPLKALRHE
jgi:predicted permease